MQRDSSSERSSCPNACSYAHDLACTLSRGAVRGCGVQQRRRMPSHMKIWDPVGFSAALRSCVHALFSAVAIMWRNYHALLCS